MNLKKIYSIRHEFNSLIKIPDYSRVLLFILEKKKPHQIQNKRAPCIVGHKRKLFTQRRYDRLAKVKYLFSFDTGSVTRKRSAEIFIQMGQQH